MKKKIIIIIIVLIILTITGILILNLKNNNNTKLDTDKKVLTLYFSMSGNTETVAKYINKNIGGEIIKIETDKTYPTNYNELTNIAKEEKDKKERPSLKTKININNYDTIFLGYPIWYSDMPMAIYTLLDEYDFSNKTIIPFATHGGSGLSNTPNKIQQLEPNAKVLEGLEIRGNEAKNSEKEIINYINKIN